MDGLQAVSAPDPVHRASDFLCAAKNAVGIPECLSCCKRRKRINLHRIALSLEFDVFSLQLSYSMC